MPASLFDKLPFRQAIEALLDRLAISKPQFLELDRANRSRAFTMARIADETLLENIHDELSIAIAEGETWPQFAKRLEDLKQRSGWTGTSPWHHRLVYDQNLGMAYSAGRVQQGSEAGLKVWRYLPSTSATPRAEHAQYYGNLYRMAPGSPVPPIDFGCNCGWVWVFEDELESMGVDPATLPVFDPPTPKSGFTWSATDYVASKATEATDSTVASWVDQAADAAASLSESQLVRFMQWADGIGSLVELQERLAEALPRIGSDDLVELNHQATLAALLRGRVAEQEKVMTTQANTARGDHRIVCSQVPAEAGRILLIPWGQVEGLSGSFMVDDAAAAAIVEAFSRQGTELPIDYEHAGLGGAFASPDGKAPAAGWIKAIEPVPGEGIFGQVEWTEAGGKMVAAKEYRYLSPVVIVRRGGVIRLHSAALTNTPAIPNMPAIVNKEQENTMDSLIADLRMALGLAETATPEEVLSAALAKLKSGDEEKGGDEVIASKDLVMANKALTEQVEALKAQVAESGWNVFVAEHSNSVALAPAKRQKMRELFLAGHADHVREIVANSTRVTRAEDLPVGTGGHMTGDRSAAIHMARTRFQDAKSQGERVICSERAWINTELRGRFEHLTDAEVMSLGIDRPKR